LVLETLQRNRKDEKEVSKAVGRRPGEKIFSLEKQRRKLKATD